MQLAFYFNQSLGYPQLLYSHFVFRLSALFADFRLFLFTFFQNNRIKKTSKSFSIFWVDFTA